MSPLEVLNLGKHKSSRVPRVGLSEDGKKKKLMRTSSFKERGWRKVELMVYQLLLALIWS